MALEEQGRQLGLRRSGGAGMDRRFFTAAHCGIYFAMGAAMACARVPEDSAPFGMALTAAAGPGISGVSALLGAAAGYLLGGGLEWGVRYVAASVLVYTVAFVFHELPICRRPFFMPVTAGAVMALTAWLGGFALAENWITLLAGLFLETALAFGGAYFFREALAGEGGNTEGSELRHGVAAMILLAALCIALSRILVFDTVSIGRTAALLLVMASAMKGGVLTGTAVGTVLGLAMDVANPGAPFYTMAYALSGLLSGVFGRHGRFLFVLSFVLSGALAVAAAWRTEMYVSALFETFCASVLFMLVPGSWLSRIGLLLQSTGRGSGESGLRRFAARRVKNLSEAYGELYDTVRHSLEAPGNDENVARVFDRAADAVCVKCRSKNLCWNTNYMDTLSAMNDATRAMVARGRLTPEDLPGHFRAGCGSLSAFVAAVNGELRAMIYRRQLRSRLAENRSLAWGQYADIAQVLGSVADELGSINGADPLAERRLLRYLRSLDIDAEAAVYRDGSGRLRIVIESGRLTPLTGEPDYLEKLSAIAGVRLCQPEEPGAGSSRLTLLEAEPLAVSVGIAALKKKGERVSGDRGSYFKTDSGVLCVILSDGMGTGDEAAEDSSRVIGILEKFLRSGVDPAVAMKILNSVMLLQSPDSWGYATVDLMCVDLFSGDACFYKYGAAPSYVKNGKSIRRIQGESLAVGLSPGDGSGLAPDAVRMRLSPGALALVASDGVLADTEDDWLRDVLSREETDMRSLARLVLREAEKRFGASDDMTVVTVRVEERA